MIRKAIIVVLTLGAVGTGALGTLTYSPRSWIWAYRGERLTVGVYKGMWSLSVLTAPDYDGFAVGTTPGKVFLRWKKLIKPEEVTRPWNVSAGVFQIGTRLVDPSVPGYRPRLSVRLARQLRPAELVWNMYIGVLWLLPVLFATYPTLAFIRGPVRRWRRRRKRRCLKCGYDLTGNVSGVCPECGTNVESP